jgi:hypothetical protein
LSQKFDTKTGDRKRISGPTNKWNGELEWTWNKYGIKS